MLNRKLRTDTGVLVSWALGTNVRRKFLIAPEFEVPYHLVQTISKRRAGGPKRPTACEASPSFHLLVLDPDHLPGHNCAQAAASRSLRCRALDIEIQLVLRDAICAVCLRKKRLLAARFGWGSLAKWLPPSIPFDWPVGSRRAFSAIVTGTCSNRVLLPVMVASLIAA